MANNFSYIAGDGSTITLKSTNTSGVIHVPHLYCEGDIANDAVDSGNPVKVGGQANSGTPSAVGNLDRVNAWFDQNGALIVGLRSGTAVAGYVGLEPRTSGGYTISRLVSAATTNATSVKASAGQVFGWSLWNDNAAHRFFKLYDKASAPTVGTDTPVLTIGLPPDASTEVEFATGIEFTTGIAFALTTGVADSDTNAVAANEILVNLLYK